MEKNGIKKIQNLYSSAINKMNIGDYLAALKIAYEIRDNLEANNYFSNVVGCLLIDIGLGLRKEDIISEGLTLVENDLKNLTKNEKNFANSHYNIANGYYSLFSLK